MIKDFHMHPAVILDSARFDVFAERAVACGVQQVCITDHMPLSTSNAGDRIPAGRVAEYCAIAREIAKRHEGTLSVKLGIEIDYHPDFADEIERVLSQGKFDFVVGASHMHVGQCDIFGMVSTHNAYAEAVLQNTLLAAKSGYFNAIAHLDFYRWIFTLPQRFPLRDDGYADEAHWPLIDQVLDAIRDNGLCLEINPHLAVIQGNLDSTYPSAAIVGRALDKGLRFSYGSDAHSADSVGALLPELRAHLIYGRALRAWEDSE